MNLQPSSKGFLIDRAFSSFELEFQFNPTTISERHGVRYHFSDAQGQYMPLVQFGQKEPIEVSFELFFHDNRGVGDKVETLRRLVSPVNLNAVNIYEQVAPPVCILYLGASGQYEGVVEDLSISINKYQKQTLEPQSVTAQVRFKGISTGTVNDLAFYKQTTGRG